MQYTIRNVPPGVDRKIREIARTSGKSVNEVVLEALRAQCGTDETGPHWLDGFLKTVRPLDARTVAALDAQRVVSDAERAEMWPEVGLKGKGRARRA